MLLEKYEVPTMEIVEFETEDIITTSSNVTGIDLYSMFGFEEFDVFLN